MLTTPEQMAHNLAIDALVGYELSETAIEEITDALRFYGEACEMEGFKRSNHYWIDESDRRIRCALEEAAKIAETYVEHPTDNPSLKGCRDGCMVSIARKIRALLKPEEQGR